jgi:ATP/maltotriose-dependent transcriptional regulator MalT
LNRGALALQRGDTAAAAELYQRSRTIAERIGDRGAVASALVGIGAAAAASGEAERARQAFRAAMEIAVALEYLHVLLYLVTQVASLQLAGGQPAIAAELLTGVLRDPASTRETSHLAQEVLLRCEAALPPEQFTVAVERGQRLSRDTLLDRLRITLLRPIEHAAFTSAAPMAVAPVVAPESTPNAALPEPLSERELSILEAIAEGLSNQAIADRLFLSLGTVKWYTGQIYGKLSVQTRTQAIAQARALHIIP